MNGARGIPGALLAVAILGGPVGAAETIAVPSGQAVTLHEVLRDESEGEPWIRFRFVAPRIARGLGEVTAQDAAADMDALCSGFALAYTAQHQPDAARIVISLSESDVPFGAIAPEVTQYFEAYRVEGDSCIWEEF